MNRVELQAKLFNEALLVVYDRGAPKYYVDETKVFENGEWKNMVDVFGIYQWDPNNYVCFMTDSERGMPYYNDVYDTESEACQELYEMAVRLKAIHMKELERVVFPGIAEKEATTADNTPVKNPLKKFIGETHNPFGRVAAAPLAPAYKIVSVSYSRKGKTGGSKGNRNTSKRAFWEQIQSETLSIDAARLMSLERKALYKTTPKSQKEQKAAQKAAVKAKKGTPSK